MKATALLSEEDMQKRTALHHDVRLVALVLEALQVEGVLRTVRTPLPALVVRRRLGMTAHRDDHVGELLLLENVARTVRQAGQQLLLVVGNHEEMSDDSLLPTSPT